MLQDLTIESGVSSALMVPNSHRTPVLGMGYGEPLNEDSSCLPRTLVYRVLVLAPLAFEYFVSRGRHMPRG